MKWKKSDAHPIDQNSLALASEKYDPTRWEFDEEVVADYVKEFSKGWSGIASEIRFWQWLNLAHPNYVERNGEEAVKRLKKSKRIR